MQGLSVTVIVDVWRLNSRDPAHEANWQSYQNFILFIFSCSGYELSVLFIVVAVILNH